MHVVDVDSICVKGGKKRDNRHDEKVKDVAAVAGCGGGYGYLLRGRQVANGGA